MLVMSILKKILGISPPQRPSEVNDRDLYSIEQNTPVHRYPPFDTGFPADDPELLIKSQLVLIDKIMVASGLSSPDFERLIMTVIRNYASYIHLLPATSNEHHRGAGGLFRFGLEVAFYTLQSSSGVIFSSKDSNEKRRELQPKWSYASFIAGLCCELYRPVTTLVVVDRNGQEWQQLMMPLYTWLTKNKIDRYYIRWNEPLNGADSSQRHSNSAYLLHAIIPPECLQYMNADNGQVITAMTATITGAARPNTGNMIYDLVAKSQDHVISVDLKANPEMYGRLTIGSHLEPHIIDAMRTLYRNGTWTINQKHSRLLYGLDGMYCVWKTAVTEITDLMTAKSITGVPDNEDTLAEMLMNSSMLMPNPNGGPYWDVVIPNTGKLAKTVKFIDKSLILLTDEAVAINRNIYGATAGVESIVEESVADDAHEIQSETAAVKTPEAVKPPTPEVVATQSKDPKPVPAPKPASQVDNKPKPHPAPAPTKQPLAATKAQAGEKVSPSPTPATAPVETTQEDQKPAKRSELFDTLTEDSRHLLTAILDDYINDESDHPVFYCDQGLAISVEEFNSKGISELLVLKEIGGRSGTGKRWLVTEAGSSKQYMTIKHKDKEIKAYVLNMQIATGLGFPMKKGSK